jgi:SAM-dependent methyltransferase
VQADASRPPFSIPFDLAGMFDVLEHIPNDREAMESARRLLRPGGKLLITVPAHMKLWSYSDDAAQHCRRYEIAELTEKLESAGLDVEFVSPSMTFLYPVLGLWRLLNRGAAQSDAQRFQRDLTIVPIFNEAAAWAMTTESRWVAAGHRLPFGASLEPSRLKRLFDKFRRTPRGLFSGEPEARPPFRSDRKGVVLSRTRRAHLRVRPSSAPILLAGAEHLQL